MRMPKVMWREKMANNKKTKIKANCPSCEKGILVQKNVTRRLDLQGAPVIEAEVMADVCNHCDEIYISDKNIAEASKLFLEKLLNIFLKRPSELPGKVATWIRKEISLSARDLALKAGIKESTLSHANTNNSILDRFTATVLLLMANDKLNGTNIGENAISKLSNLENFWSNTIPTDNIVEQIRSKTDSISIAWAATNVQRPVARGRGVTKATQPKPIPLFPAHNVLKSNPYKHSVKKTSHKR